MRIYFENTRLVRQLAKQLTKEVRAWGDEIHLSGATIIVARTFGYDDYEDLRKFLGLADPSIPDRMVSPEEQEKRFAQYVDVLSENDFSREEAIKLVMKLRAGQWWGFGQQTVQAVAEPEIAAATCKMQFRDVTAVERFCKTLKRALRQSGLVPSIGPRKLAAKVFGYDTFGEFLECAGQGVPTPSDFYVSPEVLDARVEAYLRVLKDAGIAEEQAAHLLKDAGAEGWWQLKRVQPKLDPRQENFADRIEGTGKPTWRPNGATNSWIHRLEPRVIQDAYVMFEFDHPYDEAHLYVVLRGGEEIIGYCDDILGAFLDKVDYDLRSEVASVYREILQMPNTRAEFFILRQARVQRVSELTFVNHHHKASFENYAGFIQQGGRQLFQAAAA
ncbi:hypothetical protein [Rhizobium leguminosarum]|uniref:hypothetical protein n=1 Tax=Rhizobium leguminosarum TaxID=384 RepID=UPI0015FC2DCB|nr:hypothetical protein [Rhizobium leguminosarum]MBA8835168.1 hypothetical protein [Rhizobium leguminosarum]